MSKSRQIADRDADTLDSVNSTGFATNTLSNVTSLPATVKATLKGDKGDKGATGSTGGKGSTGAKGSVGATFSVSGSTLNITT